MFVVYRLRYAKVHSLKVRQDILRRIQCSGQDQSQHRGCHKKTIPAQRKRPEVSLSKLACLGLHSYLRFYSAGIAGELLLLLWSQTFAAVVKGANCHLLRHWRGVTCKAEDILVISVVAYVKYAESAVRTKATNTAALVTCLRFATHAICIAQSTAFNLTICQNIDLNRVDPREQRLEDNFLRLQRIDRCACCIYFILLRTKYRPVECYFRFFVLQFVKSETHFQHREI